MGGTGRFAKKGEEVMRVVVAGSRFQKNRKFVFTALDAIHARTPITRLAHGDCEGTDKLAGEWARSRGVEEVPHPADWDRWGNSAGPRRNSSMLKAESPDMAIAFPGGKGTGDLVKKAGAQGIPVTKIARYKE